MHAYRAALRQLGKARLTLAICVAVLALGLGGTTAAFSALYAVVLRPLPYPNSKQLVAVHSEFPRLHMPRLGVSPPDYVDLKQYHHLFSNAGVFFYLDLSRTGLEHAQKVNAVAVTTSLLQTLGVKPSMGRYFTDVEQRPGGPHTVLLSDAYWRTAFGHDPQILGKSIWMNGESYSIVGVMPPAFQFPNAVTQMWVPVVFKPQLLTGSGRQNVFLHMYARLAPDVPFREASLQLERISREAAVRNRADYTVDITGWKYFVVPLSEEDNRSLQSWTWVFFGSVMVLFVIVCANVGGLLVLRSTQRAFETSVRLALGAGWLRAAQPSLIETAVICAAGGFSGLFIAQLMMRILSRSDQFGELHFVAPVFAFGIAVTVLAAAVCSLYPLWSVMRSNPVEVLNAGGPQRTGSRGKQSVQRLLVVVQVAASTVLLATGGLLLHTYARLLQTPLGFDAEGVTTMYISLPPVRYRDESSRRIFYESVVDRVRRIPGVMDASACTVLPFGYGENVQPFSVAGSPRKTSLQFADGNEIGPGFFQTLRIPLLAGRYFDSRDVPGGEPVVIVDEKLAKEYFSHRSALGERIETGGRQFLIVGVVRNIRVAGLDIVERPMLYFSAAQIPMTDMALVVKASPELSRLPEIVQDIVAKIDRNQPVYNVASLPSLIDRSLQTRRFVVLLMMSFAGTGVLITAIGLYGALSYLVALRSREFGIRSTVGAEPRDLALLVFRYGVVLVVFGAVLGGAVGVVGSRYLSSELYGVRVSDPITWLSVAGLLGGIAVLTGVVPSWRASRVNAAEMLRSE